MGGDTPPDPPKNTENDELIEVKTKLNFKERPGFEAVCIEIAYKKGSKLGLIVRNYQHTVMISRLDDGSLCSEKLLVSIQRFLGIAFIADMKPLFLNLYFLGW